MSGAFFRQAPYLMQSLRSQSARTLVRLACGREHVLLGSRRAAAAAFPPLAAASAALRLSTSSVGGPGGGAGGGAGGAGIKAAAAAGASGITELLEGGDEDDTTRFVAAHAFDRGPRSAAASAAAAQDRAVALQSPQQRRPASFPEWAPQATESARSGAQRAAQAGLAGTLEPIAAAVAADRLRDAGAGSADSDDDSMEVLLDSAGQPPVWAAPAAPGAPGSPMAQYAAALNDVPYAGPLMDVLLTRGGRVLPLDDSDAALLAAKQCHTEAVARGRGPGATAPASLAAARARAAEAVLAKRALRAAYSQRELDDFVAAVELQYGRGVFDTDGLAAQGGGSGLAGARGNLSARRKDTDFRLGEDPFLDADAPALPFNLRAVTLISNLTWNAAPNSKPIDLKATVTARVAELGLPEATRQYLRSIAGARYSKRTDMLRISSERHSDAASNKRDCVERLVALVREAAGLAGLHGAMRLRRVLPSY